MFEFLDKMTALSVVDTCLDTGKQFVRVSHVRDNFYMGSEEHAELPCQLFLYQIKPKSEEGSSDESKA